MNDWYYEKWCEEKGYDPSIACLREAYKAGYADCDEEIRNPVYCTKCGSCGVEGCCPPDQCHTVQLEKAFMAIEPRYSSASGCFRSIKEAIMSSVSGGLYCEGNVKDYRDAIAELDRYHNALEKITQSYTNYVMIDIAKKALSK